MNNLKSPFLDKRILPPEPRPELSPRISTLLAQSPFERVSIQNIETDLEQGGSGAEAESYSMDAREVDIQTTDFEADGVATQPEIPTNTNVGGASKGRVAIFNFGTFKETNRFKTEAFAKGFFDTDVLFNADPSKLLHKDGLGLVEMGAAQSVFTLFRTEPNDSVLADKQRAKGKKLWASVLTDGAKYRDAYKAWIDAALQDDIDCLYLTGHHWTPGPNRFNLSTGVVGSSFRFAGESGTDTVQLGFSSDQLTFDVTHLRPKCKLIFGFGCDVATAEASKIYQSVFGRGEGDAPVICGWNTTVGLPAWNQADRSPNVRYFEYLQTFANANVDKANPPANLLQWFYDNHPMELVRAWGHATQRWMKRAARARSKDGKLFKFKLDAGKIKEVATTS